MPITVTDYVDVIQRAQSLGLNSPEGICLLPRNFDFAQSKDELVHESSAPTVRSLFRQNGIKETKIENEKLPCIQENDFSLLLPTIFVGSLILSQNPHLLSIALNIISNYATDFFKGIVGGRKVVLDVVYEDRANKKFKRIHYEGDPEGLKEVHQLAGKAFTDDK